MRVRTAGGRILILGSLLAIGVPVASASAVAASGKKSHASQPADLSTASRRAAYQRQHGAIQIAHAGHGHGGSRGVRFAGISCVPFARSESGIDVAGNAWEWWINAAGSYARGHMPEPGSVLSFSSNGRMRLGHVAVVKQVINPREIEIGHANWAGARGGVARNVAGVVLSENNDWTAVSVGLGRSGDFGSVYPTNGFIYDRPDNGIMLASAAAPAPRPALNPAPNDLRPWAQRTADTDGFDEVAEAPAPRLSYSHSYRHKAAAPARHKAAAKRTQTAQR
jgi:hypothetical protein